jgi:NAD(P)-dependent dehydrogenase (short-subunit alcohol dehydrogenase family)
MGAYDASKGALELLSDALQTELEPFGVRVVIVEPGNVRTEWTGRSMVLAEARIPAYDGTAGASRRFFAELHGHQEGDPDTVAAAIRDAVATEDPPRRLVIGADAHQWIREKLDLQERDLDRWRPSA